MKEMLEKWFNEKGLAKWFQRDNLIILVLTGVLLFIIALPTGGKEKVQQEDPSSVLSKAEQNSESGGNTGGKNSQGSAYEQTEETYAAYLENKLTKLLAKVSGVGKVQVMITLSSSAELVVEKDEPYNRSQTNETDSEGGNRIITQMEEQETTVYRTEGSSSEPYVVKTLLPKVEGVVVVAEGAGKGSVNQSITEIVQALFDLEAHKVKVVKMQGAK